MEYKSLAMIMATSKLAKLGYEFSRNDKAIIISNRSESLEFDDEEQYAEWALTHLEVFYE